MAEWFVLALVVFVVGGFIAAYARRRAREDITIEATPERIWAVITDYHRLPDWQPETEKVEVASDGKSWTETHKDGLVYRYRTDHAQAMQRIGWRYDAVLPGDESRPLDRESGGGRGVGGKWTLALEPRDGGCRVRSRVVDRRTGSFWRRTLNAVRGPRSHQGMYLECLKAHVEGDDRVASATAAPAQAEAPASLPSNG